MLPTDNNKITREMSTVMKDLIPAGNLLKVLQDNKMIFNVWFETWLISHVPKLMEHPKWFRIDQDVKICDVVMSIKNDGLRVNTCQYRMGNGTELSRDGLILKVIITYKNSNKNIDGFTTRAVRKLVLIHPVDKIKIMEELRNIASTSSIISYLDRIRCPLTICLGV